MSAITVKNLSKAYKQYPNLGLRLCEWLLGGFKTFHRLNWILKDITFSVNPGEAVGIVGMNGAGKSTLLKIITGTSHPTLGTVVNNGKVAALLELGVGFHPEFTGRQNVFIAGQLLGYSRKDIVRLMPDIEAFAEIGSYIDQPLRVYSSGMKMRLAFSIATVVKPDVMIVDEALSIGDSYFQHKCFKRIRELLKQGTALLFVSHDSTAVTAICDKAILLHNGSITMEGKPELVMNYYKALLADFSGKNVHQSMHSSGKFQIISGSGEASVIKIALYNDKNESVNVVHVGEPVRLSMVVQAGVDLADLTVGYEIKDIYGLPIFGTNTYHLDYMLTHLERGELIEVDFCFAANIGIGDYSISVALHSSYNHLEKNYEWRDLALTFRVANVDKPAFLGTSWLPPRVECARRLAPSKQQEELFIV
jgi:lipopolysaccharide transport system ATP-binding protein